MSYEYLYAIKTVVSVSYKYPRWLKTVVLVSYEFVRAYKTSVLISIEIIVALKQFYWAGNGMICGWKRNEVCGYCILLFS